MLHDVSSGLKFFDADDFHPEKNVAKMAAGEPPTNEDRHLTILQNCFTNPKINFDNFADLFDKSKDQVALAQHIGLFATRPSRLHSRLLRAEAKLSRNSSVKSHLH